MKVMIGELTVEFQEDEAQFAIRVLRALLADDEPKPPKKPAKAQPPKTTTKPLKVRTTTLTEQEQGVYDNVVALKDENNMLYRNKLLEYYREHTPNNPGWVSSLKRIQQKGYIVRVERGIYKVVA